MLHDLEDLSLLSASTVTATTLAPVIGLVLLAVVARRARQTTGARAADPRRTAGELALGALLGALGGLALAFVLGDVMDLFGVVLSLPTRGWTAIGGTGLGILVVAVVRSGRSVTGIGGTGRPARRIRVLHRVLAVLVVPLVVLTSAIGINADLQEYPNVRPRSASPASVRSTRPTSRRPSPRKGSRPRTPPCPSRSRGRRERSSPRTAASDP